VLIIISLHSHNRRDMEKPGNSHQLYKNISIAELLKEYTICPEQNYISGAQNEENCIVVNRVKISFSLLFCRTANPKRLRYTILPASFIVIEKSE